MKNKCVVCGKRISETEDHYESYGNYCFRCSNRATNLAVAKAAIKFLGGKLEKAEAEGNRAIIFRGTIETNKEPRIKSFEEVEEMLESEKVELKILIKSAPQYYSDKIPLRV